MTAKPHLPKHLIVIAVRCRNIGWLVFSILLSLNSLRAEPSDTLLVHSGPGSEYPIVKKLQKTTRNILVFGFPVTDWVQIEVGPTKGYARYTDIDRTAIASDCFVTLELFDDDFSPAHKIATKLDHTKLGTPGLPVKGREQYWSTVEFVSPAAKMLLCPFFVHPKDDRRDIHFNRDIGQVTGRTQWNCGDLNKVVFVIRLQTFPGKNGQPPRPFITESFLGSPALNHGRFSKDSYYCYQDKADPPKHFPSTTEIGFFTKIEAPLERDDFLMFYDRCLIPYGTPELFWADPRSAADLLKWIRCPDARSYKKN